jgi:REP element-mobilizing transposase RayT
MLKAWQAVGARIYIWDYTTDYVHYLVPMANWAVVAENTRFFIQNGVRGIRYEAEATDMDEMRGWVWAKQLWNPELDTQALVAAVRRTVPLATTMAESIAAMRDWAKHRARPASAIAPEDTSTTSWPRAGTASHGTTTPSGTSSRDGCSSVSSSPSSHSA